MTYDEALRYLDEHVNLEKAAAIAAGRVEGLSLDTMRAVLGVLGDPQESYPVIHLTGTNGKGSVGAMVEVLLEEHGLVVGTYSSPHLERVNERLRWTGEALLDVDTEGTVVRRRRPEGGGDIDDDSFARVVDEVAGAELIAGVRPSYFEILTAAAFSWFADLPVDAAAVEVGLLGRFDATNVANAQVAVVTNIGHDHTDFEGDWRVKVATEKAGIVKADSILVVGERDPDVLPIFERAVDGDPERLWLAGRDFDIAINDEAVGGRMLDLRVPSGVIDGVFLPVHGEHQAMNAAIAVATVEAFFGRALDAEVVRGAFARLVLPGRFEVMQHEPLIVIDGAHNIEGCAAVARTLDEEFTYDGRLILVVGMLEGRDVLAMYEALEARDADVVVTCTAPSPRAIDAQRLAHVARKLGIAATAIHDPAEAIEQARTVASPDDVIVIVGSMYVAGAARAALRVSGSD
ncbi:MAG: bifunctional folylpolyglutamate synthase/dihydrofolate synthase [Actinobacteria bacterium]|nr:bifunctional folylpolyglutamate synthase/dihydrofolate synthase [Actinomycetota bacterium]